MTNQGKRHKGVFAVRIKLVVVSALVLAVVALLGVVGASAASRSYVVKASLDTKQVGSLKDAVGANGLLTGKLTVAGKKSTFTWTLSFKHLSGVAKRADIYFGARGKTGTLVLPLCVKCQAPSTHGSYTGAYVATSTFLHGLLHGGAYAIISTRENPKGEIRGQIKATSA
jgi:CHRD domain